MSTITQKGSIDGLPGEALPTVSLPVKPQIELPLKKIWLSSQGIIASNRSSQTCGARMSKPAGKCVFCGGIGDLTKSHIWPEWIAKILPQTATHHQQIVGEFATFVPKVAASSYWKRIRPGHVGTRKPRNTCKKCNGDWMRRLEESAMLIMPPLLLGEQYLLNVFSQRLLASFLCLVCMRVELASRDLRAIPASDRNWLMNRFEASPHWKIWIARYEGDPRMDQRHTTMHVASSPNVPTGIEHCNSQVTTLVIGHLYVHLFSSTVWPDFPGYEGVELTSIWPPCQFDIEVSMLPVIAEAEVPWLHETIGRTSPPINQ
jgi:hypothetical protein